MSNKAEAAYHDPTTVCDGCWKRGVCDRPGGCRCPCIRDGWLHADNPLNPRSKK